MLSTLDLKDLGQNVRILDGDTIKVYKSKNPVLKQISKAIKSNINPRFINVIGGRVENPGPIKINKTGTLNDAIELAGGAKIIRGSIIFLRYKNDGSIDRRKFRYNPNSIRGSEKNPYLSGGDIVYVGKSNINKFNEVIKEVTGPIPNIIQSYTFYRLLTDD